MQIVVDAPTRRSLPEACLVCVNGEDLGRTLRVDRTVTIGRRGDLELAATDVSRAHARVAITDHGYVIEDLGSVNGTYIDGVRVTHPTPVRFGAHIQVGRTIMLFSRYDELEERVFRTEQLETMAVMAAGLAHDFNNALAVIVSNLEPIDDALPKGGGDACEALEAVRRAATSATNLARRLQHLGSREPLTGGVVEVPSLVEHTLTMVRRRAHKRIAIATDVPADLIVYGSFEELHQVLVNLYFNSCDAMPDGGSFRISARAVELDAQAVVQHQLELPGGYIEIIVADSGIGMDTETRARAFEPFFTTKGADRGTGLGLAMVHSTIRRHGGAIELDSEPGRGTSFRIYLQRAHLDRD